MCWSFWELLIGLCSLRYSSEDINPNRGHPKGFLEPVVCFNAKGRGGEGATTTPPPPATTLHLPECRFPADKHLSR